MDHPKIILVFRYDFDFESGYHQHVDRLARTKKLVKVFILPHSHNDPGWRNTYEQYYNGQTKHILDNAVNKLKELPQMTFVWSEITYLAKWWKEASLIAREQFRKLVVDERRLEIATAGWVVSDEATTTLYTLVTELTEGQQWVKQHLGTTAKYSWAIDPFGHSATHSHLLKQSGMQGMVIIRQRYAWKHWLAEHKSGAFRWRPRWDFKGHEDILCLALPFDLYSTKHACGPETQVCLKFDFRSIAYEYGENHGLMTPVTKSNVGQLAEEIVAQYHKTASLYNHNVILVPLGDDFRYEKALEWEQQYSNYISLFTHINNNKDTFRMEIRFGTPRDYFEAVEAEEREANANGVLSSRPSLSGDFFPYSDVYVSGSPEYWTGFYGSRPYWKKFHREVENELRSAEILFTYANMLAKQLNAFLETKILNYKYQDLIAARQHFSVFAHHDGITGTSHTRTMEDYAARLYSAYWKCISVQQESLKIIYEKNPLRKSLPGMLTKDFQREKFEWLPSKIPLEFFAEHDGYATKLMIFNNLGWSRTELVKVLVKRAVTVKVTDSKGNYVPSQINPVFTHDERNEIIHVSEEMYELAFLASLEPLSTNVFKITKIGVAGEGKKENFGDSDEITGYSKMAVVSCDNCENLVDSKYFWEKRIEQEDLTLENSENRLHFQKNGLLESVQLKKDNTILPVKLSFGMYRPENYHSGPYLLKLAMSQESKFFHSTKPMLIRISGPVMSQLISIHYDRSQLIKVNTTLVHPSDTTPNSPSVAQGILLETYVDFTRDTSSRAEVYMRLDTGINSLTFGAANSMPYSEPEGAQPGYNTTNLADGNLAMYTDQNGLVCEKRLHIPSLPYEGNTYPVTSMAYLQDEQKKMRFSVLVDRTHGFCSVKNGRLESLVERKSLFHDGRGMSEGVGDGKPTVSSYVLLVENLKGNEKMASSEAFASWQPTLAAYKHSFRQNYPPNLFVITEPNEGSGDGKEYKFGEATISLISTALQDNVHLVNLRTLSAKDNEIEVAGTEALLNFQNLLDFESDLRRKRQCNNKNKNGSGEKIGINSEDKLTSGASNPMKGFQMNYLNVSRVVRTSLTGVEDEPMAKNGPLSEDENGTQQQVKQASSLLVNFKLDFVRRDYASAENSEDATTGRTHLDPWAYIKEYL